MESLCRLVRTYLHKHHQLQLECSCDWADNDKSNSVILVCVTLLSDQSDYIKLDRIVDYRTVSLFCCVVSCQAALCYIF
jgi:hypothetical protein